MIYLTDPVLGRLDLDCADGFVVTSFEIGFPEVREVMTPRSLSDGSVDTTAYLGPRPVTVALRFDQTKLATQNLLDLVTPFLSPRYRPQVVWTVQQNDVGCIGPSSSVETTRSLRVRGVDGPLVVDAPKYLSMVLQWISQDPYTSGLDQHCAVALITGSEEFGRTYDLEFDREYPYSPQYGVTSFTPLGNAPMDWTGTVTSELVDPQLLVNDTTITFSGLTLLAGQTIDINTQERTILRNNDPEDSLYGITNFADWTWDEIRLTPGENQIRLQADSYTGSPSFTLCYFDKWFS
jgi:hypothetical protein